MNEHLIHTAKDRRFDGVFYIGVLSTGIYCRPICPAKTPKPENCTYHPSAAAAEKAGFRPCLRCRPELAPGRSPADAVGRQASLAARFIEEGLPLAQITEKLGISDRHLRRIFHQEFGVSPVELAQTQRLLHAKRLLTDTRLSVSEVALASGFGSLRRFNDLFQARYHLNPRSFRKRLPSRVPENTLRFQLAYRPPFDFEATLTFFRKRAFGGFEVADETTYWRTVSTPSGPGWFSVRHRPERLTLEVEMSPLLLPRLARVLGKVRAMFDLSANPEAIERCMPELVKNPGLRLPVGFDPYETAVRAIIGQQVSVAAAVTVSRRLAMAFGEAAELPGPLNALPFQAQAIAEAEERHLCALGLNGARARALIAISRAVVDGQVDFFTANPERLTEEMVQIPGVGKWTAEYVVMRGLGWPDVFPAGDLMVRRALGDISERAARQHAERWRPWRSYAVLHLWAGLATPPEESPRTRPSRTQEKRQPRADQSGCLTNG